MVNANTEIDGEVQDRRRQRSDGQRRRYKGNVRRIITEHYEPDKISLYRREASYTR